MASISWSNARLTAEVAELYKKVLALSVRLDAVLEQTAVFDRGQPFDGDPVARAATQQIINENKAMEAKVARLQGSVLTLVKENGELRERIMDLHAVLDDRAKVWYEGERDPV